MLSHFRGEVTGLGRQRCKPATDLHCDVNSPKPTFRLPSEACKKSAVVTWPRVVSSGLGCFKMKTTKIKVRFGRKDG